MARFQAVYYRAADGTEPVREFLGALGPRERAALARQVGRMNLLSDQAPHLPFPHSSQVRGELRELRCHFGRSLYRVLYRRSERLLVLLHAFGKRTRDVPASEIRIADVRWRDYRLRMSASSPPGLRPIGSDAP